MAVDSCFLNIRVGGGEPEPPRSSEFDPKRLLGRRELQDLGGADATRRGSVATVVLTSVLTFAAELCNVTLEWLELTVELCRLLESWHVRRVTLAPDFDCTELSRLCPRERGVFMTESEML